MDTYQPRDGGFNAAAYLRPQMVAALLDDAWEVLLDEQGPLNSPVDGVGAHHLDPGLRVYRLR